MTIEVCIRLSDGFYEIQQDGVLLAEVHPTDMRAQTSVNAVQHIVRSAQDGTLPAYMRPVNRG